MPDQAAASRVRDETVRAASSFIGRASFVSRTLSDGTSVAPATLPCQPLARRLQPLACRLQPLARRLQPLARRLQPLACRAASPYACRMTKRIIVVGGDIAGLTAAYTLRKDGKLRKLPLCGLDKTQGHAVYRWPELVPPFYHGYIRSLATFQRRRDRSDRVFFAVDYLVGPYTEAALTSGLRADADVRSRFAPGAIPSLVETA
jgi:hypothetical protein